MPFTLRLFNDEAKAKLGVLECERHGLMQPYQVIFFFFNIKCFFLLLLISEK